MHAHIDGSCWRWWFRDPWTLEVSWSRRWFQLAFEYGQHCGSGDPHFHISVPFLSVFLTVPIRHDRPDAINGWAYGFAVRPEDLFIYHGDDTGKRGSSPWLFEWPWKRWHHVRHDVQGIKHTYPYSYELNSGEVQARKATIQVEEREWRWLHSRLPFKKISRYIDVTFDEEVGERTGSWKGGTIGCSYELCPRETPIMCLRRMERERSF